MIYHSKQIIKSYSFRTVIEFIMFLNRQITDSESRYWFIKLKFADLIWILRKIKHMIELIFLPSIIYTDDEAAVDISKQKFLWTFFIDKLNLQLIKAFKYIQRFNLIIKHKSKKKHIISDALFRFKKNESNFVFSKKKIERSNNVRLE